MSLREEPHILRGLLTPEIAFLRWCCWQIIVTSFEYGAAHTKLYHQAWFNYSLFQASASCKDWYQGLNDLAWFPTPKMPETVQAPIATTATTATTATRRLNCLHIMLRVTTDCPRNANKARPRLFLV